VESTTVRIGLKISLSCLTIAAVAGIAGWLSAMRGQMLRAELEELRLGSMRELLGASDMNLALKATHAATQELLADAWRSGGTAHTPANASRATRAIEDGLDEFARQLAASRRATEAALALAVAQGDQRSIEEERFELRVWLDDLADEFSVHRALLDELVMLAERDPQAALDLLNHSIEPHYRERMLPAIRAYRADARRELVAAARTVERSLREADRTNLLAALGAALLALLAGAFLTRSIARPLRALRDAALDIGTGDLATRVASSRATSSAFSPVPSTPWPNDSRRRRCRSTTSTRSCTRSATSCSSRIAKDGSGAPTERRSSFSAGRRTT
jgi:hypothetical protein